MLVAHIPSTYKGITGLDNLRYKQKLSKQQFQILQLFFKGCVCGVLAYMQGPFKSVLHVSNMAVQDIHG